ncbi:hypothetical protein B0H34DRAFT_681285 [Crassisporium funariophilum]|nr:hypothetical protein B0H34DRAFT_681285 [Crassisporium funariophilum]
MSAPIHVDLSNTIGALQIGSLFAVFLFGIVTLQAHLYYNSFREDRWTYKVLVAVVWILEVGHTAGVSYEVYNATITLYGRPQLLVRFPGLGAITAVGGMITLCVQGFFALRLYRVLPKPYSYIGVFCFLLSFLRCIGSIYLTVQAVTAPNITVYRITWKWLISTLLTVGAVIDVIIAASMLYYLNKKRENALVRATRLIDSLIAYTIRTGLLTSVSAVTLLICFQLMPANLIWLALYTFLAKLYSNSLLSALNSRTQIREDIKNASSVERYSQARAKISRRETGNPAHVGFGSHAISIEMKTTTETTQDDAFLPDKSALDPQSPSSPYHMSHERQV